ncbi:MAG: CZB domain-containing protein [Chromatiaceae bacterium]|nr:CZB domain-containing protein [Chromatiaceae bacterium]
MNKIEALSAIRRAKSAHLKWRAFAQALIAGVPVTDDKVPKLHTECDFGKWYYGDAKKHLWHLDAYQGIESPHEMLHAIYGRIFNILHGMEGERLFSRLFTTKAERERRRSEIAQNLLVELVAVSETLLRAIEILEIEVQATPTLPD